MLDVLSELVPEGKSVGRILNRQTSLPPVSEGRASGAALRAPSPPSGRGVCLISSSCPGSQTTMTGSELAGHRLLGSARHAVLRTALLARRGGAGPPLKRPPPPALRAPPAPSGGGLSVAIGPGRRDRQVSLRPVHGGLCSPPLWSRRGGSRCAVRPCRAGRGHPG